MTEREARYVKLCKEWINEPDGKKKKILLKKTLYAQKMVLAEQKRKERGR